MPDRELLTEEIKRRFYDRYDDALTTVEYDDDGNIVGVRHAEIVALEAVAPLIVAEELRYWARHLVEVFSPDTPQIHSAMDFLRFRADQLERGL